MNQELFLRREAEHKTFISAIDKLLQEVKEWKRMIPLPQVSFEDPGLRNLWAEVSGKVEDYNIFPRPEVFKVYLEEFIIG